VNAAPDTRTTEVAAGDWSRVVIESVTPEVDGGRFPAKRILGDAVAVEADVFADGPDRVASAVRYRHEEDHDWSEVPMVSLANDRWRGTFTVDRPGRWLFTVTGWVDSFASWLAELARRPPADPDLPACFAVGAALIHQSAAHAPDSVRGYLSEVASELAEGTDEAARRELVAREEVRGLIQAHWPRDRTATYERELAIIVDRTRARTSAWYEFFPRSFGRDGHHGRLRDLEPMLDYVAQLGFDVVYLPPIHAIGRTGRKGPNNQLDAPVDAVGSPWAIGGGGTGHKDVHPELGSAADFEWFVKAAQRRGLEVAMDLALQCSPDHPYVHDHPAWFRHRPDGSIQYAENPPKKYQDIYPLNFESEDWLALWREVESIVDCWIERGVRIFRVDNPHTKPMAFWEWLIASVKHRHPDVLFLAEAFTRPIVMHRLAKIGFTQSYTYFTWRNTKRELSEYFTELFLSPGREYFRPCLWPNTPDILHEYLQLGGRPAFMIRAILAATLSASWGVYGPAFELCEGKPREPESEEYLDSEKYQLRQWDLRRSDSLAPLLARLNEIRRTHPALQQDWNLSFHAVDNEYLLCYSKWTEKETLLMVVNLDAHRPQSGYIVVPFNHLRARAGTAYQVHDLLSQARYLWTGERNYVALDPSGVPAHIFLIRTRMRREQDFDYYD
jgi:starch synthase (maltosyl-transferring)